MFVCQLKICAIKSVMQTVDTAELSTVQHVEWPKILNCGGMKGSMRLHSALGTFGRARYTIKREIVVLTDIIDTIRWCMYERRLARSKYPWLVMR